jgi:hypothetical protein
MQAKGPGLEFASNAGWSPGRAGFRDASVRAASGAAGQCAAARGRPTARRRCTTPRSIPSNTGGSGAVANSIPQTHRQVPVQHALPRQSRHCRRNLFAHLMGGHGVIRGMVARCVCVCVCVCVHTHPCVLVQVWEEGVREREWAAGGPRGAHCIGGSASLLRYGADGSDGEAPSPRVSNDELRLGLGPPSIITNGPSRHRRWRRAPRCQVTPRCSAPAPQLAGGPSQTRGGASRSPLLRPTARLFA